MFNKIKNCYLNSSKKNILIYLFIFLITFSLVYTSTLNPFTKRIMNVDTSVYVTITQGISRGLVLYQDLADNKGPLTYLISLPGFLVGGITGIWITEFIILFITFIFMHKTALLFVEKKTALFSVFFTSLAMHPFFYVNAGAEEYSLPFLTISLFIFTKHYIKNKVSFFEILILGICFSSSIMIRLNMFPLWAGFCFSILIESIIKKKYLDLIKYIGAFCLGICFVFIPILLYMKHNNIFNEFYHNVIMGGVTRGFRLLILRDFLHNFYTIINRSFSFIPLCIGTIWLFMKYKNINFFYFLGFIFSYFLSVLFLSFSLGNSHYNLILIPFFVPALAFLSDSILNLFFMVKCKYLALLIFFCITFSEGIIRFSYYMFFNFDSVTPLKIAGKIIDEHTQPGDKILNLGWNGYIYPYTKRDYASKYIFQSEAFDHIPGAREEFISSIKNNKPRVMTIFTAEYGANYQFRAGWHEEILALLETNYTLISNEYGIQIFLLN